MYMDGSIGPAPALVQDLPEMLTVAHMNLKGPR